MSAVRANRTAHMSELAEQVDRARRSATGDRAPVRQPEWRRADWMQRIEGAIGSLSAPLQRETTERQFGDFIQLTEEADTCWRCPATTELRDPKGNLVGFEGCRIGSHYLRLADVHNATIQHDSAGRLLPDEQHYQVQIAVFHKTRCPGPKIRRSILAERRSSARFSRHVIPAVEVDVATPFDPPAAATPTNQPNGAET